MRDASRPDELSTEAMHATRRCGTPCEPRGGWLRGRLHLRVDRRKTEQPVERIVPLARHAAHQLAPILRHPIDAFATNGEIALDEVDVRKRQRPPRGP